MKGLTAYKPPVQMAVVVVYGIVLVVRVVLVIMVLMVAFFVYFVRTALLVMM